MKVFNFFKRKDNKTVKEKLAVFGAEISPFMTNEKWLDENGEIVYIDYAPINWNKVFGEDKNEKISL